MSKTRIEWCDKVWNPISGCTSASRGCLECYARKMSKRLAGRYGYPADEPFRPVTHPNKLADPLGWKKPAIIFVNSMGDLFHKEISREYIATVFGIMAASPQHFFIVLTKRAERMRAWFEWLKTHTTYTTELGGCLHYAQKECDHKILSWPGPILAQPWPLPNVGLGVSVCENKDRHMIDDLLQTPASCRIISAEPLLGALNLEPYLISCEGCDNDGSAAIMPHSHNLCDIACTKTTDQNGYPLYAGIDWLICGGESGTGTYVRPCHPDWLRRLRDDASSTDTPYFFKQWGTYAAIDKPHEQDNPAGCAKNERILNLAGGHGFHGEEVYRVRKVGKKKSGRLLDGRTHDEFPEIMRPWL